MLEISNLCHLGGSSFSCDQGPHVLGHQKNDLGSAVPVELPKLLRNFFGEFFESEHFKTKTADTGETEREWIPFG